MKYKKESFRGYKKTNILSMAEMAAVAMLEEIERENQPLKNRWIKICEKQENGTYKPLKYLDNSSTPLNWIFY